MKRELIGLFNGSGIVDENGKIYHVPENYAGKSRLIEGDRLKLYVNDLGEYIFKLINPAQRRKVRAKVIRAEWGREYVISCNNIHYKVLPATGTFFKLEVGDEVVAITPVIVCNWATIEKKIDKEDLDLEMN